MKRVALVGNPNTGKSSLFNRLTGLSQKIANYPGVTVEHHVGRSGAGVDAFELVDLPGTYSLVGRSPDERVACDFLDGRTSGRRPDLVCVVVDACQPGRGLFLLSQIVDMGIPAVVALNMVDEAREAGVSPDSERLSRAARGVPVIPTVAVTGEGVDALRTAVVAALADSNASPSTIAAVETEAGSAWRAARRADPDGKDPNESARRYAWVRGVLAEAGWKPPLGVRPSTDRLDAWFLHPIFGFVLFLAVMGAIFQAVFTLAAPLQDAVESAVATLGAWAGTVVPDGFLRDITTQAVFPGVGAVVVFLPQILILFLLLGLLEDTGYMTRAAFIVDRPLRAIGLSGRAFIPLMSSFACAVPGIMATRVIEDRRERLITILVSPLMTCSARLPVYTVAIGVLIPEGATVGPFGARGVTLLALYVGGALFGSLAAFVLGRTVLRGRRDAPILEMPPYRLPEWRAVVTRVWHRGWSFLRRAGTVIFGISVLLWVLSTYPRVDVPDGTPPAAAAAARLHGSFAGMAGRAIEPLIDPLGFDWRVGIGLLASFAAREVFVSTMGVVYAVGAGDAEVTEAQLEGAFRTAVHDGTTVPVFGIASLIALLLFYMIAPQCVSTLAVIRREAGGWGWAALAFTYLTVLAYVVAWAGRQIVLAFVG